MKRKTRKHIAPQLELPEAEKAFNLAGETQKEKTGRCPGCGQTRVLHPVFCMDLCEECIKQEERRAKYIEQTRPLFGQLENPEL